jgi:hypothetical protein
MNPMLRDGKFSGVLSSSDDQLNNHILDFMSCKEELGQHKGISISSRLSIDQMSRIVSQKKRSTGMVSMMFTEC